MYSSRKVCKSKNNYFIIYQLVGCKEDYRKPVEVKKKEYKEVFKLLKAGYHITKVAKLADISENTVKRLKKEFGI